LPVYQDRSQDRARGWSELQRLVDPHETIVDEMLNLRVAQRARLHRDCA
jgi:hypothetical protein